MPISKGSFTNLNGFSNDGVDGKLIFNTTDDRIVGLTSIISCKADNANVDLVFAICVNGTPIVKTFYTSQSASTNYSVSISGLKSLTLGDEIQVYVGNMTDVSSIRITSISIQAHG